MSKKRDILTKEELAFYNWKEVDIEYPFCYKTKNGQNYFRYLEDGRFENVVINKNNSAIMYGTYTNSLSGLLNENNFYFKVIANRETIITNEEFEIFRNYVYSQYHKYLDGEVYVAKEVEQIIKLSSSTEAIVKESIIDSNDIISNVEDPPF